MGPKSRDVLAEVTDADLGVGFPWLSARQITVAGHPVLALRVSYLGELGWELHMDTAYMREVFLALEKAGQPHGLGFYGAFAANSMRLEKGYRGWGSDLTTERTPVESGVGFLVKTEGHDFMGRDALCARMAAAKPWEMVLLEIETDGFDPFYAHSVHQGGDVDRHRHLGRAWPPHRQDAGAGLSARDEPTHGPERGNPWAILPGADPRLPAL